MTITIRIDTGNAAFEDEGVYFSLIHVLAGFHQRVRDKGIAGADGMHLQDRNGNTVGSVTVTGK